MIKRNVKSSLFCVCLQVALLGLSNCTAVFYNLPKGAGGGGSGGQILEPKFELSHLAERLDSHILWIADDQVPGRFLACFAVLPDGKILLAGGRHFVDGVSTVMDDVRYFDPETLEWTAGPAMPEARRAECKLFENGKVALIQGNAAGTRTTLIFDIHSEEWSYGPTFGNDVMGAVGMFKDDKFFVLGGAHNGTLCSNGMCYRVNILSTDPITGEVVLSAGASLPFTTRSAWHSIIELADGRWLQGGAYYGTNSMALSTANQSSWSLLNNVITDPRRNSGLLYELEPGKVLIMGSSGNQAGTFSPRAVATLDVDTLQETLYPDIPFDLACHNSAGRNFHTLRPYDSSTMFGLCYPTPYGFVVNLDNFSAELVAQPSNVPEFRNDGANIELDNGLIFMIREPLDESNGYGFMNFHDIFHIQLEHSTDIEYSKDIKTGQGVLMPDPNDAMAFYFFAQAEGTHVLEISNSDLDLKQEISVEATKLFE